MSEAAQTAARQSGQASVELVAVIPLLLVALAVVAQLALAGHALWSAGIAARAGARVAHVGGDGGEAAREALPGALRDGAQVSEGESVGVRVRVPALVPLLPPVHVRAETALEPADD